MTNQILESNSQNEKEGDSQNRSMNNTVNSVDLLFNQSQSMMKSPAALQNLTDLIFQQMRLDQVGELKGNAPTIPVNDLKGPDSAQYSKAEKNLRCSLAALYRLIDLNGWTQSIYNHVTVRSSSDPKHYLINPFGLLYHEIQASSLVLIDSEGTILDPGSSVLGINKAGWVLHSAIHEHRKDVNCIIHVHVPDVVAVSCIKSGLLPVSPEAQELINTYGVKYHDYQGILLDENMIKSIQTDIGDESKILFLRNHGVAVAGSTIPEAWYLLRRVITACQTQMRLLQLGAGKAILDQLQSTNQLAPLKKSSSIHNQQRPFEGLVDSKNGDENLSSGHIDEKIDNEIWTVPEQEFEAEMRVLDSAGYKTGHVYKKPNLLRKNPMNATMLRMGGDTMMTGNNYDTMADASVLMSDSMGDDVATASQAGKSQMNKIAENVRLHREKSQSRNSRPNGDTLSTSTLRKSFRTSATLPSRGVSILSSASTMNYTDLNTITENDTNLPTLAYDKKHSNMKLHSINGFGDSFDFSDPISTPKDVNVTPKNLVNQKSLLNSSSTTHYEQSSHHQNGQKMNGKTDKTVTLPSNNELKNTNTSSNNQGLLDAATIAENKKKSNSFRNIFKRKD